MKHVTGCLLVLLLNSICWAGFGGVSRQKHPKQTAATASRKANGVGSVQTLASPSADVTKSTIDTAALVAMKTGEAAALAPLKEAAMAMLPTSAKIALDDIVLNEPAALALNDVTLNDVRPNNVALNGVAANDVPSNDVPRSLHVVVGNWIKNSSPSIDPELSGGIMSFRVGSQTDVGASVALRLTPTPLRKGEGSGNSGEGWGLEIGSILPHEVSGGFDTADQNQGAAAYSAKLSSFYEIHAAAIHALPHGRQEWAIPEVGLGLSLLHVTDTIASVTTTRWYGGTYQTSVSNSQGRWILSPLVRVGVVLFPQSLMTLRLGAAYVGYANTAHSLGQTFDLGISGLMVEEAVQLRL